jgi:uncharacterized protein GlcG (DUF336 family)
MQVLQLENARTPPRPRDGITMKSALFVAAMLSVGPVLADINPAPTIGPPPTPDEQKQPRPPRARGITTALAIEAAVAANAACAANNYKTTALITDSAGVPIALISNDGAAAITQRIAMSKAHATLKYGIASGEVAAKAAADPAFAAEVKANPLIETARRGAIPIKVGSELIGAFAVSGAPGGDKDEPCALAGLAKIQSRIK